MEDSMCSTCGERRVTYRTAQQCRRCYSREWYRDNAAHARVPAADRRDPVTYANAHWRVQNVRGKASEYVCTCGAPAEEWSYTPGDAHEQTGHVIQRGGTTFMRWSPNPNAFEPLCRPCHVRKDGGTT